MKKLINLSIVLVLVTFSSCSSTKNMQEFYSKYDDQSTVIPLPSFALKLASKAGGINLFNYFKSAKLFIINDAGKNKQERVMQDLESSIRGERYEKLVKLKAKNNNLNIAIKENSGKINKMIFGVNGLNKVLVLESSLNISRDELDQLLDKIDPSDIQDLANILK